MKLRIIHIVTDDKFVDGAITLFECDDRVDNKYVVIGDETDFKYIKCNKVGFVSENDVIDVINRYDVVIIHSVPAIPLRLIVNIDKRVKVVWFAWGYDIYEEPYIFIPVALYGPRTKLYLLPGILKDRLFFPNKETKREVDKYKNSFLERVDYFSGVFPYEEELLKHYQPSFNAKGLDFYYGSTNFFIPEFYEETIVHGKKNIIIGNSGNPTGNHLDVLAALSKINLDEETRLIIPLSYGGSERYKKTIEKRANRLAPNRVVSLRNYLPLDQYLDIISSCRTAIFAHERQQASDNIFLQMLYGARVFLSETSQAYDYLKKIGFCVYALQKDYDLINIELSDEEVLNNRQLLSSNYSSTKLIGRVKEINTILMTNQ